MSDATQQRLTELTKRAALRSMTVRKAPEVGVWELANPFRVVVTGSLDNVAAWLTAAEERDGCPPTVVENIGVRADG
ncbi:hypothetical protein [Nocardia thailandica]